MVILGHEYINELLKRHLAPYHAVTLEGTA